jgi:peptidoglycan/xylan/chitin deacetylase (PgdA/CDA1 family)
MTRENGALVSGRRAVVRAGRPFAALVAAAAASQYVPSVVALGQWGPFRALPGELCRWQGPPVAPHVALTFDDGPDPEWTPRVLDVLAELGIPATFFVVGARARAHPDLVEELVRRGHQLATHGDEHARHLLRTPMWVRRDLGRACDTMAALGHQATWYRPAYGQATAATLGVARAMGLRTVLWSAWGREWASTGPGEVAARIVRRLAPGAVVLLHDSDRYGPPGMARRALGALPLVAEEVRRLRLEPVTMDGLVRRP